LRRETQVSLLFFYLYFSRGHGPRVSFLLPACITPPYEGLTPTPDSPICCGV
jgi:hypothetical protein